MAEPGETIPTFSTGGTTTLVIYYTPASPPDSDTFAFRMQVSQFYATWHPASRRGTCDFL